METLTKDLIGRMVELDASGAYCAVAFHGCIGKITEVNDTSINVFITTGHCIGVTVLFPIGEQYFKYKIINEDWDQ